MRNAFANEICSLAEADQRIVLLSGDIGNRLFNPYQELMPNRFYNCGVAEANMASVAAGMALCGLRPVTYTITAFNTVRCLDQIKVDICYQNVPVIMVGVGSGLSYASLNATHHSLEDIAVLRAIPNISILCPGDAWEVRAALRVALKHDGPVYIRIGKKNEPTIHEAVPKDFTIGKGLVIRPGRDACILSTGNMLPTAMEVANILSKSNMSVQVVSFHTVKPLDEGLLEHIFSEFSLISTLEEHSIIGGLGSAVCEWASDSGQRKRPLIRFGCTDRFLDHATEQEDAKEFFGLTAESVALRIRDALPMRENGNSGVLS